MAWKRDEVISPSECGEATGSSRDAHAESSRYRHPSTAVQGDLLSSYLLTREPLSSGVILEETSSMATPLTTPRTGS